jgi:hypothetical protein
MQVDQLVGTVPFNEHTSIGLSLAMLLETSIALLFSQARFNATGAVWNEPSINTAGRRNDATLRAKRCLIQFGKLMQQPWWFFLLQHFAGEHITYSTWFHSGQISPPDLNGSSPLELRITSSNLDCS